MGETLLTMIEDFERNFPGWGWLIRNDEEQGYFVNLTSPDFQSLYSSKDNGASTSFFNGARFPAYGSTMELAFGNAFKQLRTTLAQG
jgi:hypothetical protein